MLTGAGRAFCAGADLEGGSDTFANREESGGRKSDEGRNTRNVYPNEIDKTSNRGDQRRRRRNRNDLSHAV